MVTSMQPCNCNVKSTTSFRRGYYNVAPMFGQLCDKCKLEIISGHMVIFTQPCLKVMKKFNNGKVLSKDLEISKNDNWQYCRLNICRKKFPHFRFSQYFKNKYFQRMPCNKLISRKKWNKDFQLKRFNKKMFVKLKPKKIRLV